MAVWSRGALLRVACVTAPRRGTPTERSRYVADTLMTMLAKCSIVYIEEPFIDVHGSRTRASAQRQDVVKLCLVTGAISAALRPGVAQLIPVREWKGQLPKDISWERTSRYLLHQKVEPSLWGVIIRSLSHVKDAIGLGVHIIKKTKKGAP